MRRGSSKRARVRGKEGDFFSSCKPFQLCSGLRTEAVREREGRGKLVEPTRFKGREEELRGTLFHSHHGVETGERRLRRESEREGSVSWDCLLVERGRPCLQSRAWTGAGRAVWDFALWIQSHDSPLCPSRLPSCLPGWSRIQPPAPLLSPLYPQMPSFTPASPLQEHACFRSTVPALPWSCR